jgi:hypothetical protein
MFGEQSDRIACGRADIDEWELIDDLSCVHALTLY